MPKKQIASFIFCTGFACLFSANIQAQKKDFTADQLLKDSLPDIVNPLPRVSSWNTDNELILSKRGADNKGFQQYRYDFKTKAQVPYRPAKEEGTKRVFTRNNDLYFADGKNETRLTNDDDKEVNATFSPDSNYVAYTKNNNLYAVEIATQKETQFTNDGSDSLMNGYASWVYTEEILGRASRYRAFWWSPNSRQIAFFKTDDHPVPVFTLTNSAGQHGSIEKIRYPKAGDPNPEVKIGIAHLDNSPLTWADFNEKDDQYFGMPYWDAQGNLLAVWINRDQNDLKIFKVNTANGQKELYYEEQQKTWIDLDDQDRLTFLQNGKTLMLSDKTGWRHIYVRNSEAGKFEPVTQGKYTVTGIEYTDEKNGVVYFTARGMENTARTDLYRVQLNGKNLKRLTFGDYNHRVQMSPTGKYFVTTYSNTHTPPRLTLLDNNGKIVAELGNSKGSAMDDYNLAKTELIRVKSDDGLYDLPAVVTWPTHMDPNKKYPVLISIYGGPNAGSVWDNFSFSATREWYAKEGLIQIAMDHRASGHFGKEGVNYMYRNLGYWEMKDYSTIVKYLVEKGQADPEKICITGFSYGGYMSSYATTYGADVFKYGMAGGSVTDWSLYDSHYTEKFMDTPKDNPEGYKSSSVFTWVNKYKSGSLQLVHGEIDDNVHLQNSLQLASLLQDQKKQFEFMVYPGGRHGWGGNKGLHFQNMKTLFIYKNLLGKEAPDALLK